MKTEGANCGLSAQPRAMYSSQAFHQCFDGRFDRFVLKRPASILQRYTEGKAFLMRVQPTGSA